LRASIAGHPKVSVVIPVMNERRTIAAVIREASRVHPSTEVIVVANGCKDGSDRVAERLGACVVRFELPLGHDVGRSIGAHMAKGDIVLFTDADIVVPAVKLSAFVRAVDSGVDVALNRYLGPIGKRRVHGVVLAKHAMNAMIGQSGLKGASMTTIPHAVSRRALETIGIENLAVPPKAMVVASASGLAIQSVQYVEVGKSNPRKRRNGKRDLLERLIVGDHLEALHWFVSQRPPRGGLSDLGRLRDKVR